MATRAGAKVYGLRGLKQKPTLPTLPKYRAPKMDYGRIRSLQQEQLAPTYGLLQNQIRDVQAGSYANPMERERAIRGAVRGFGESLAGAGAQATRTAHGLYQPEYQAEREEAQLDYKDKIGLLNTQYATDLADYESEQERLYAPGGLIEQIQQEINLDVYNQKTFSKD